jgi:hypothetical protein
MKAPLACLSVLLISACGGTAFRDADPDTDEPDARTDSPRPLQPSDAPASDAPTPSAEVTPPTDETPSEPDAELAGNGNFEQPSPGFACTEVGCLSGFQLELDKQTPWQPGAYVFRGLGSNGLEHRCGVTLAPGEMTFGSRCDGFFMSREAGTFVPASARVQLVAEQVELEVLFEGQRIAFAEYTPVWITSRPNGPECEPVCMNSSAQTLRIE